MKEYKISGYLYEKKQRRKYSQIRNKRENREYFRKKSSKRHIIKKSTKLYSKKIQDRNYQRRHQKAKSNKHTFINDYSINCFFGTEKKININNHFYLDSSKNNAQAIKSPDNGNKKFILIKSNQKYSKK